MIESAEIERSILQSARDSYRAALGELAKVARKASLRLGSDGFPDIESALIAATSSVEMTRSAYREAVKLRIDPPPSVATKLYVVQVRTLNMGLPDGEVAVIDHGTFMSLGMASGRAQYHAAQLREAGWKHANSEVVPDAYTANTYLNEGTGEIRDVWLYRNRCLRCLKPPAPYGAALQGSLVCAVECKAQGKRSA